MHAVMEKLVGALNTLLHSFLIVHYMSRAKYEMNTDMNLMTSVF